MTEDKKKVSEAYERAKKAHDDARVKLNNVRNECTKTLLHFQCRWLGNYKKRVEAAQKFEEATSPVVEQALEQPSNDLRYCLDVATNPRCLRKAYCISMQ